MKAIRLLLADDHPLFRKGLAKLLENDPEFEIVAEAQNGAEAIAMARALKPDLVLMDLHMPGVDGLKATRVLREELPGTRVIMLTVSESDRDLFEAIKCGAHGYLTKKIEPEELREMVTGVFRGEAPLSRASAAKILAEFRAETTRSEGERDDALSARERDVLRLLADGLTNKEIGNRLDLAENTVKNHLKSILAKLHLQNRVQAAAHAIQHGLKSEKDTAL